MFAGRVGRVRLGLLVVLGLLVWGLASGATPFDEAGVGWALERGHSPQPVDYWASFGFPFAVADVVLLALAIAFVPLWLGGTQVSEVAGLGRPRRRLAGVLLVLAAMATLAVLAWPRLSHSLWDDESYAVARVIAGNWVVDERSGEIDYKKTDWAAAFWFYRKPTNHVPASILARTTAKLAKRDDKRVDERALRAPAFVFGLLAVGAVAWMLWRLGFGTAGIFAAWLVALHPWTLRYTAEARGYSMAMFLGCLSVTAAVAALHRGAWRAWLGFGAAQFFLLWTNPSVVYFLVLLNLAILASLLRLHPGPSERREQVTRWSAVNILGGMLWLPLMAPNVPQLLRYLAEGSSKVWITPRFLRDSAANLISGMDWRHGGAPLYPELSAMVSEHPLPACTLIAALVLLVLAGAARLVRSGVVRRNLAFPLLLALPVTVFYLWLRDDRSYTWYFVFFVPQLAALAALGATWLLEAGRARRPVAAGGVVLATLVLVGFAWLTEPGRSALRARAYFPERDSVLLTRPSLDPSSAENGRILTATWTSPPVYYDPQARYVPKHEDFLAVIAEAEERGLPLFVNFGRRNMAVRRAPENLALVEDPSRFEHIATLPGYTPVRTRYVYRYLGGDDPPR